MATGASSGAMVSGGVATFKGDYSGCDLLVATLGKGPSGIIQVLKDLIRPCPIKLGRVRGGSEYMPRGTYLPTA